MDWQSIPDLNEALALPPFADRFDPNVYKGKKVIPPGRCRHHGPHCRMTDKELLGKEVRLDGYTDTRGIITELHYSTVMLEGRTYRDAVYIIARDEAIPFAQKGDACKLVYDADEDIVGVYMATQTTKEGGRTFVATMAWNLVL